MSALRVTDRALEFVAWAAAALVMIVLFAGPSLIGAEKEAPAKALSPAAATGKQVFADNGCGGCHKLAAADSTGVSGPDLDAAKPDAARVADIVRSGAGAMPAFGSQLSPDEIAAVAELVASTAGG